MAPVLALLLAAVPASGAGEQAQASATILPGVEVDFARFAADPPEPDVWRLGRYRDARPDEDGAVRELRLIEFE